MRVRLANEYICSDVLLVFEACKIIFEINGFVGHYVFAGLEIYECCDTILPVSICHGNKHTGHLTCVMVNQLNLFSSVLNFSHAPNPMSARFLIIEGGRPYEPMKSEVAGQSMYGHQAVQPKSLDKEFWKDAADTVAASMTPNSRVADCSALSSRV